MVKLITTVDFKNCHLTIIIMITFSGPRNSQLYNVNIANLFGHNRSQWQTALETNHFSLFLFIAWQREQHGWSLQIRLTCTRMLCPRLDWRVLYDLWACCLHLGHDWHKDPLHWTPSLVLCAVDSNPILWLGAGGQRRETSWLNKLKRSPPWHLQAASFCNCIINCEDFSSNSVIFHPHFKYMFHTFIFIYLSFTGVYITSS